MAPTLVSICLPAFNGARWIGAAVDSALAQTYPELELVVVDDGSTDGTPELVRAYDDERIRLVVNGAPLGPAANHNLAVREARGPLVKFLHQDDLLAPGCLARLVPLFAESPRVGLAFSRREVLVDPDDAVALAWRDRYARLHDGLGPLERVNDGPALLARYLPALGGPLLPNWIGEPSTVMASRAALDRAGPFTTRMSQSWDVELWLRIMASFDIGFIDEALASYRSHAASLTRANAARNEEWLDLAWLYEGLLATEELGDARALVRRYRRRETGRLVRRTAGRVVRRRGLEGLGGYAGYRAGRALGRRPALHG